MRLFYEEYVSRGRAALLLVLADSLAAASVTVFARGIWAEEGHLEDTVLVALWAIIPRVVAEFLGWFQRPREFFLGFASSTVFVLLTAVLLVAGWELVVGTLPRDLRPSAITVLLMFLAWGSGFLLHIPRFYVVSDFLIGAVALLGLLERRPMPQVLLPAMILGLTLSAANRHILHDVFPTRRRRWLNLQNARAAGLLLALVSTALFVTLFALLGPRIASPAPARPGVRSGARGLFPIRALPEPARSWRSSYRAAAPPDGRATGAPGSPPRRGYTHRVALTALDRPLGDPRVVLRVRPAGLRGEPSSAWAPDGGTLFRGVSLGTFDPEVAAWRDDSEHHRVEWGADGTLAVGPVPPATPAVGLEVEVVVPVFRNLITPYDTVRVGPLTPRDATSGVFRSAAGDFFPVPPLEKGDRYGVACVPRLLSEPLEFPPRSGPHPDPAYLAIPEAAEIGVDLRRLATMIAPRSASSGEKLRALERFFREGGFRYSEDAGWVGSARRLAAFLNETRAGNCAYFATATALLGRALEVPTRLTVGFLGAEPDGNGGGYLVRNDSAHAWVEAYFPGDGWVPVDPTRWVPRASPDGSTAAGGVARPGEAPAGDDLRGDHGNAARERTRGRDDGHSVARPSGRPSAVGGDPAASLGVPRGASGAGRDDHGGWLTVTPLEGEASNSASSAARAAGRSWAPAGRARGPRRGTSRGAFGLILRTAVVLFGSLALSIGALGLRRRNTPPPEDETARDALDDALPDRSDDLPVLQEMRGAPTPRLEIVYEYHVLQRYLLRTRAARHPNQTPLEHAAKFRGRHRGLDKAFQTLHRHLYRVLYGSRDAGARDVDAVRESCRTIRRHLG